jgi:hypothetical protein
MIDKIFPRKLNRSKDARLLDKTEMYNAINISIDDFDTAVDNISDTGDAGVIKPVKGNDAIGQNAAVVESGESARVIGSVVDEVNGQIYLFVFSTNAEKQGVYRITADDSVEPVYVSEYFEFQDADFVKGDIVYHSDGNVILYFTDGRNEPKKLSLDAAAITAATGAGASRVKDFITACPKTPMHPPTWEFFSEPTKPINFRSVEGFQFAYQCIYSTGEESAISTYSDVAIPAPYLTQGSLTEPNLEAANGLRVRIPKAVRGIPNYTDNIERIRLLVRIGNNGAFFTVSEKDAATGSNDLTFDFYNDSVLTGVPQEDQDKLNDALPRIARAQTVINDRLIYGNYTEGYETNPVLASLSTINTPRPEDFVDLRIGIRPLISPAFDEFAEDITVGLVDEDFTITNSTYPDKVFNRRASYQFDLSDLPSVLPAGSIAEISFAIEPDGNFELYDSDNSFHTFKNNGFGLSETRPKNESISNKYRGIKKNSSGGVDYVENDGSPTRFQNNNGVGASGLRWQQTDPGNTFGISLAPNEDVTFGTSPSNPFIIPQALIKFRAKFKIESEVSGASAVRNFISNLLKSYFSDGNVNLPNVDFTPSETALDIDLVADRAPTVAIDQFMDSSNGYGFITDEDKRARTVVSCFKKSEYVATGSNEAESLTPALGYFAINKANVTFSLRYSDAVNTAVSSSSDFNVGPVFSLHVQEVSDIETVTMIPRITRSGARGWIYFTKSYIVNPTNIDDIRKICFLDSPVLPEPGFNSVANKNFNLFFLADHFCPITDNTSAQAQNALEQGQLDGTDFPQGTQFLVDLKVIPADFLNAGGNEVVSPDGEYSDSGIFTTGRLAFSGFQGNADFEGLVGIASQQVLVSEDTELDNDFRVSAGKSEYPNGYTTLANKLRHIGYLDLSGSSPIGLPDRIIRIADPIAESETDEAAGVVYSIIDGEANIRRNYTDLPTGGGGRLSPSYWYGVYYDTEYAGRNNNQFALSEGSNSPNFVGLHHGGFSYKGFSGQEKANIVDELIPEIEPGRSSFSLTSTSSSSGATGRSFKRNCSHSFALLYYDERGRPGEPVPLGSHFVAQVDNPGLASIRLDIDESSTAPEWAHTYKVLYGGNNSISDFVQYTAGGAFTPPISDDKNGVIYVSLNYLQHNNEVSYSKSFGAVRSDGDKDLYTYSEGDILRVISYFNDDSEVVYPRVGNPYEFQVIDTVTLSDDPVDNPLAVEGEEVHPAKTGQFVVVKDNRQAQGFSFEDVANSGSDGQTSVEIYNPNNYWNRRCVFEIFSPQKKKEVESRVYYEIGKSYNVVISNEKPVHQTQSILIDQGDVYFRKMAVNMPDFNVSDNTFLGLIGDGRDTINENTAPNFRSYHLESKAFTDIFPNADVLPYGKPRVALQKGQPTISSGSIQSGSSSNQYTRRSSLKFSDRSNANSNIVRYTSFNDSKLPFKDLQANDGEIFSLLNYADSIFCIQRLKCSSIPVSRSILSDALGNETVINTAKVLGTEKYYAGNYGTDVPESVTQADSAVYFVSVRNKEVYRFNPNSGIEVISEKGMGSFFDSVLSNAESSPPYKVTGGFDADQQEFILSVTAPLSTLVNPDRPAPFNTVAANEVSIQDFLDFTPVEVGPVVEVNQAELDEITELEQQVFELEQENTFLETVNQQLVSIQEFLGGGGVGGGITEAELQSTIDGVVSTIIGAVGDGQLSPEDYANPGPLTPEQLAAIDAAIDSLETTRFEEGADSVDITVDNNDAFVSGFDEGVASVDTQEFYVTGFNEGISSVDTDTFYNDGFSDGQLSVDTDGLYTSGFEAGQASVDTVTPYNDGFSAGQDSVDITSDNPQVYNDGFVAGQESVDTVAPYNEGFTAGVDSVDITVDNEDAYTSGFDQGVASVDTTVSYNEGFTAGVGSVDITSDNPQVYSEGFSAGQAAVDLSDTGSLTDAQRAQLEAIQAAAEAAGLQSFDLDLLATVAEDQAEGGLVDLQGFTQAQIDAYNSINSAPASEFQAIRSAFATQSISSAEAETLFNQLYNKNPNARRGDLNQDGNVSTADLLEFLSYYGGTLPAFDVPSFIPEEYLITTDTDDGGGTPGPDDGGGSAPN